MSETTEPAPLTQFQMNQFVMLSALPMLAPALAPVESRLRWLEAELAALKKADPLAEMWRELSEYQPMADAYGYGEAWRRMCEERTPGLAMHASLAATQDAAKAGAWAAAHAQESINAIRRAKEAKS